MKYIIDFEHIFFDRYNLDSKEKQDEARAILKSVFKDMKAFENTIETKFSSVEEENDFENKCRILKSEFFIRLLPFCERTEEAEAEAEDDISEAANYIRRKYLYEELNKNEVLKHCKLTSRQAEKDFILKFGKSINEYIRDVRIEKAKECLRNGIKNEEAAYLCGFGSVRTMQRAFKSALGKTPAEYKGAKLDSGDVE